eukprot:365069-Chlamydomonas_euryale.AAC.5
MQTPTHGLYSSTTVTVVVAGCEDDSKDEVARIAAPRCLAATPGEAWEPATLAAATLVAAEL